MNDLFIYLWAATLTLGQAPGGTAPQAGGGAAASAASNAASTDGLADPYVDGSYGFSVRPPTGWRLSRVRTRVGPAVTLLEMAEHVPPSLDRSNPGLDHSIVIQRAQAIEGETIDAVLQRCFEDMYEDYMNVKVEKSRPRTLAGKPGAVVTAFYDAEGVRNMRIQAAVEFRPRQYLMVQYRGPESAKATDGPLFERVADSLALIPDAFDAEQLRKAGEAGFLWLKDVGASGLKKAVAAETYYRVDVGGKLVGLLGVAEGPAEHEEREGLEIRERMWTFTADGTAQRIQSNAFISLDLRHEDWKGSVSTLLPARDKEPRRLIGSLEDAVRVDDVLLSNRVYTLDQPPEPNPPYHLPPTYLSRALARMLPRLTPRLFEPRVIALAVFDPARADVVMRIVEIKGEATAPGVGAKGTTYRIDVRDGPASSPTTTYVDEDGAVVLVLAGSMTMRPASREELERVFAERIASAEKAMAAEEAKYREEAGRFARRAGGDEGVAPKAKDYNDPKTRKPPKKPNLPPVPPRQKPEKPRLRP